MIRFNQIYFLVLFLILPFSINGQLISIKTVPLATGEQFLIFPSQKLGMANVSIAVNDPFLDPFINPAKGGIHTISKVFSSPSLYKISDNENSSKTLSLSLLLSKNRWFSGLSLSLQNLYLNRQTFGSTLNDDGLNNSYFYGSYGRRIGKDQTFLAGSIYWSDLSGIDGVEHLYSGFKEFRQYGNILDMRIGFYKQLKTNSTIETLVLYNHFDMTHEFTNSEWWPIDSFRSIIRENNYDRTNTWGLHVGYVQPLLTSQWDLGLVFTANWKSHPKIPNYDLMRIPRDPGNSWAYNFGVGLAKSNDIFTFGFDIIYEPIWSNTWADAQNTIETVSGKRILKGEKTVDNDFVFSNSIIRLGVTSEDSRRGFQLGLQIHSISYHLEQHNFVEEFRRKLHENWREWTLCWGIFFKFKDFRLHYAGRMITGTGRPGIIDDRRATAGFAETMDSSNFLIAPAGSLALDEVHILTHQLIVSVSI